MVFYIDSGASHTILSTAMYHLIPAAKKPVLNVAQELEMSQADGTLVNISGTATVEIQLGKVIQPIEIIVADIKTDCILGRDFLQATNAEISFGKRVMTINGEQIQCIPRPGDDVSCNKLHVTQTVRIPAGHEMIVRAATPGTYWDSDNANSCFGLVQPLECNNLSNKEILVARSVVDPQNSICVRLCNFGSQDQIVKEGTVVAEISPLHDADILQPKEPDKPEHVTTDCPAHVEALLKEALQEVDECDKPLISSLITQHADVFSSGETDIGRTNLVQHHIDTGNARPVKQRPRRAPIQQQTEIDRQVQMLLDHDLISPSQSPWATPVVLVAKKGSGWRLCCDYRKLNDLTIKDAYPLPRIDDTLDRLYGATWFCTLDLKSGYWQVELSEDAKQKSAFTVQSGLYNWNVMPFGLCNAPSTFERLMEHILHGLHWKTLLIYLDDVIVFGRTVAETASRLEEVFQRLGQAGLKLNPSKCFLFKPQVHYLGHIVSAEGIHTNPNKVQAIQDWPVPKTVTHVRSFLGLASYYRRFIHHFADVAKPLHHLTGKNTRFEWTDKCQAAFEELKKRLMTAPILAYPAEEGQYILDVDASAFAMGGVLSQVQDDKERVIAYGSKSFSKEQKNYCVTRRELLAVVHFLKYYRHYLYGRPVRVRTDHAALKWLCNFKEAEGQLARWLEVLSSYNMQIEHRPGLRHQNADALSRRPCYQCGCDTCPDSKPKRCTRSTSADKSSAEVIKLMPVTPTSTVESTPVTAASEGLTESVTACKSDKPSPVATCTSRHATVLEVQPVVTLKQIREEQLKDCTMNLIMTTLESGEDRPEWKTVSSAAPDLKAYWSVWNLLYIKDGVLCRKWVDANTADFTPRIILPPSLRDLCINELHNSKAAGHLGYTKTLRRVKDRYFWVGMTVDLRSYLRKCIQCARRKRPARKRRAKLRQYRVGSPLDRVAVDILGPLPETTKGNLYVMVIGDYFTKWVEIHPIPDQTAETVAQKLTEEFICRFGCPSELHSDQGRNFESRVFAEVLRLLGVRKTRTTPYNPKSDGMIERFNRTLLNMVSMMIEPVKNQRDWDELLPFVGFAYRSSVHESTGETPNMLMFGREVKLPLDLMVEPFQDEELEPKDANLMTDYAEDLRDRIRLAHERAREVLRKSARRQKRTYDRKANGNPIQKGDFVWLFVHQRKPGFTNKLRLPWDGPFLVVEQLSDVHVRIQKSPRSKCKVYHIDNLKPYEGPPLVAWKTRSTDGHQPDTGEPEVHKAAPDQRDVEPVIAEQEEPNLPEPVTAVPNELDPLTAVPIDTEDKNTSSVGSDKDDPGHATRLNMPNVDSSRKPEKTTEMPVADAAQSRRNPRRDRQLPARYRLSPLLVTKPQVLHSHGMPWYWTPGFTMETIYEDQMFYSSSCGTS